MSTDATFPTKPSAFLTNVITHVRIEGYGQYAGTKGPDRRGAPGDPCEDAASPLHADGADAVLRGKRGASFHRGEGPRDGALLHRGRRNGHRRLRCPGAG